MGSPARPAGANDSSLIAHRLNATDQRLDTIDQRLDAVDQRLDAMDQRLAAMDGRIGQLDSRVGALAVLVARMDTKINIVMGILGAIGAGASFLLIRLLAG